MFLLLVCICVFGTWESVLGIWEDVFGIWDYEIPVILSECVWVVGWYFYSCVFVYLVFGNVYLVFWRNSHNVFRMRLVGGLVLLALVAFNPIYGQSDCNCTPCKVITFTG